MLLSPLVLKWLRSYSGSMENEVNPNVSTNLMSGGVSTQEP